MRVTMESANSVSQWIDQLKAGDPVAVECLWGRYFERLVGCARARLRGAPRRAADEEDVALSAFDSFCRGVERGRFPELLDRDSLWRLLVTLTLRKVNDLRRKEQRQKRGGGRVVMESDLPGTLDSAVGLERIIDPELTPELAVEVAEECRWLLGRLNDAALQTLALLKMEGYTNSELAARLRCGQRTIERKLRLIRTLWKEAYLE